MIRERKKEILLVVLVVILIVEVFLLGRTMFADSRIKSELEKIQNAQVEVSSKLGKLSDMTLQEYVENDQAKDQLTQISKVVSENKVSLKDLPKSSGEIKNQIRNVEDSMKDNTDQMTMIQHEFDSAKIISESFEEDTFNGNVLVDNLYLSKPVKEETREQLTTYVSELPESERQKTLSSASTDINKQSDALTKAKTNIKKYVEDGKVVATPNDDELVELSSSIDAVGHAGVKEELLNQVALIQTQLAKENGTSTQSTEKLVALTFDDGPNSTSTGRVLDILKENDVPATFFVLGQMVENNEDMLKRINDEGHEIGNHSYDHSDLSKLDSASVKNQIDSTNKAVEKVTGKKPTLLRPPYGAYNDTVLGASDMTIALWNIDTLDWQSHNPTAIVNEVKNQLQPQSLILMHDIHEDTADSLDSMIKYLKSEGYRFCLTSELLPMVGNVS